MGSFLARSTPFHQISWNSGQWFFHYPAHKQTNNTENNLLDGRSVCFVARYRSGLRLSETTRLFASLTQRPSHPSKHRVLQPQPRRHLRLTPTLCRWAEGSARGLFLWLQGPPENLLPEMLLRKTLKQSVKENITWRMSGVPQMAVLPSVLHPSCSASSSILLRLGLKLMSTSIRNI